MIDERLAIELQQIQRQLAVISASEKTRYITASKTWDPASLADGASDSTTITVTGAAITDRCLQSAHTAFGANNIQVTTFVQAANTVRVVVTNHSGGVLDIASGTLYVTVVKVGT